MKGGIGILMHKGRLSEPPENAINMPQNTYLSLSFSGPDVFKYFWYIINKAYVMTAKYSIQNKINVGPAIGQLFIKSKVSNLLIKRVE